MKYVDKFSHEVNLIWDKAKDIVEKYLLIPTDNPSIYDKRYCCLKVTDDEIDELKRRGIKYTFRQKSKKGVNENMKQKSLKTNKKGTKKDREYWLSLLEGLKKDIFERELSFNPNDSIIEVINKNAYKFLAYDDIVCYFESYLEDLTVEEFFYMTNHNVIDEIYHEYMSFDYYGWEYIQEATSNVVRRMKEQIKESKK